MSDANEFKRGMCCICLEKITEENTGVCCCGCLKKFHLACCKFDRNTRNNKDRLANWECISCVQNKELKEMIGRQEVKLKEIERTSKKVAALTSEFVALKTSLPNLISEEINNALDSNNKKLNDDLLVTQSDQQAVTNKVLSIQRNDLRREIIISGFPNHLNPDSFFNIIEKTCSHHNINITISDVYNCYWINKKKLLLVKFNSLLIRDALMRNYHLKRDLTLQDVFPCNISSRIYLNDNNPDVLRKMIVYSRKLQKDNLITSFKINYKSEEIAIHNIDESLATFKDFDALRTKYPFPLKDKDDGSSTASAN